MMKVLVKICLTLLTVIGSSHSSSPTGSPSETPFFAARHHSFLGRPAWEMMRASGQSGSTV